MSSSLELTTGVDWKPIWLLVIMSFVLYGNTLNYGYVLDDDVVFLHNQYVQNGLDGIGDILTHGFLTGFNGTNDQSYRPIVLISFALEHAIFGNNPFIGHLINILLYAGCGILVWLFFQLTLKNYSPYVSLIAALIFIAHPIHTEVVANIKGRDDILHFIFAVGALYLAVRYAKNEKLIDLLCSGLLFFLALLCKEMAVTFLAIIPITWWIFSGWKWQKTGIYSAPYVGILIVYLLIRSAVLEEITFENDLQVINNGLVAASNEFDRVITCLFILLMYIKLLFFPHPLSWDYSFNQIPIVSVFSAQGIITVLLLVALSFAALMGLSKRKMYGWIILFFFITMSVVSNIFIMIGATLGERFLFTPSLAFSLLFVLIGAKITKTDLMTLHWKKQKLFMGIAGVALLLFSLKTISRNKVWESNIALYESGVETAPNSTRTWYALGTKYRLEGERSTNPSKRFKLFQKAIEHYKKSVSILDENFEAWYNMGIAFNQIGKPEEALQTFRKTVAINPQYASAWNNIGVIYFNQTKYDSASVNYQRVLAIDPNHVDALGNMGTIFHNSGKVNEAIKWYLKALSIHPNNRNTARNLALAYRQTGQIDKSKAYQQIADGIK